MFNSGKGVAIRVKIQQWSAAGPQRVFTYKPAVAELSALDMAPGLQAGVSSVSGFSEALSEEQLKAISEQRMFIWVYGLIEYWDETFEKPRRHLRQFCSFYLPTSSDPQSLGVCPENNKTIE